MHVWTGHNNNNHPPYYHAMLICVPLALPLQSVIHAFSTATLCDTLDLNSARPIPKSFTFQMLEKILSYLWIDFLLLLRHWDSWQHADIIIRYSVHTAQQTHYSQFESQMFSTGLKLPQVSSPTVSHATKQLVGRLMGWGGLWDGWYKI